ncbi:MAG: GntR family transcriptional regulator, partial [Burkholderiales bacterium]
IPLPLPKADLKAIVAAQRKHDLAVQAGDAKAVFLANFDFHFALFAACGNPYLASAIDDFRIRTHVVWSYAIVRPEYFRNAQREHQAMLKAIRDCDRRKLIDLCTAHLNISRRAYVEARGLRLER